jgi:hypothetical protein
MSPAIATVEPFTAAYRSSLTELVKAHLREIGAEVEAHHAKVRTELVEHAAAAEAMVGVAIEHCLGRHRGERCDADPNECLDVQVALAAADAAAEMVAAWLIVAGTGTFTPRSEEEAREEAFHLIAEAAALQETADDPELSWEDVLCSIERAGVDLEPGWGDA